MKKAVALGFKIYQDNAPKVIASAKGTLAERIISKAKEFNIPLLQNEELVNSMLHLKLEEEVPPELYEALSSVFAWLYECEEKAQLSKDD